MATQTVTTQQTYTSSSSQTEFTNGIQILKQDDLDVWITDSDTEYGEGVKVLQVRGATAGSAIGSSHPQVTGAVLPALASTVKQRGYTLTDSDTKVVLNASPTTGSTVVLDRHTDDSSYTTFASGSTIRSSELNTAFDQARFTAQEARNLADDVEGKKLDLAGGVMTGHLRIGEDQTVIFEGATDNAYETTLTVTDPTADRTITIPNVTGTVVTTGDTGTVTSAMLASGSVATADIAADAVTGAKIADDSIDSEHYVDGSIDTAHIADSQVTTAKIAADAVTGAKIANAAVGAEHIEQLDADVSFADSSAAKFGTGNDLNIFHDGSNSYIKDTGTGNLTLQANQVNFVNAAGTETLMQVNEDADVQLFHNNSKKFETTAAGATVTGTLTADLADDSIDSEHYVDASIDHAHLANDCVDGDNIADDAIDSEHYTDGSIDTAHIADDAVTVAKIGMARIETLAGMQSGTASKLADSTALTSDIADLNQIDGLTKQTTISDSDASFPTSGAVVDYVAAQIAPIGGLEVIADEDNFPTTQPASGVVISISDAAGIVINGSGVSTTARTAGNGSDNVTINNFPSSLYSETLASGNGLMVTSTGSSHTYNYHKLLASESDVKQLSDDINDFAARYRVAGSAPSSSLDDGDLWWDSSTDKLKVYNGSAWEEVASSGNFYINTISSSSSTGGGSATFNGSAYRFTLSNPGSDAQQHLVSVNGIIQKPNSGTSQPSEGFAISSGDIIFSAAPAASSDYFIVTIGATVSIGTPSDNTVTTAILQNSSVTTAKLGADAVTGDKIADDAINSEHYTDGSIDTAHIADSQVTTAKLASDAVTNAKIADDSIDSEHYVDGSIDTAHLAADVITGAKIADDAIDSEHYTDGSIDTAHIADNAITAAKIAADSVGYSELAVGAVGNENLAADAVSSGKMADSSVATAALQDDAVTLAKMAGLARGKIIYGDASGNPAALAIGTSGKVLKSDGTDISWGDAAAGATGGSTDKIFWENGQTVTTNYTITNNMNAGSFGPITINSGVTVTVGAGEVWSII